MTNHSNKMDKLEKRIEELEKLLEEKNQEVLQFKKEIDHATKIISQVNKELASEIKLTEMIQKVLSPTTIPNINGVEISAKFIPGTESGGDYYDIFELEDPMKFGLIMASSSGYSVSAWFLSILIKLSSLAEARKGLSPHLLLNHIYNELKEHLSTKEYASIFYGVIDRRSFELNYTMAGSISAIHQINGEEELSFLNLDTFKHPLSPSYNPAQSTSQVVTLSPRDRLILSTEGITRSKNIKGQYFGVDRLKAAILKAPRIGPHDVRNEIYFQVVNFLENKDPLRDQTVLVTEVRDKVIKLAKKKHL